MKQIIHNLRQKPEKIRRHILHVSIIACAVILLFLWIYTLGRNLNNPDTQAKISNDLKPLATLKDNLIGGYRSISGSQ